MNRCYAALFLMSAIAGGTLPLEAQQKFPPEKFVNLQVFPNDATPGAVINTMKNFTRALGVRCQFCHVGEEGMPLEQFDFVADTKPEKQTARIMMRMASDINAQISKAMPDAASKGYQVTCFTCHRGAQHPQHVPQ